MNDALTRKYSYGLGYLLNVAGKIIPYYTTPIAYNYNGVILPALPEWNETVYPYVVIINTSNNDIPSYILRMFEGEPYISGANLKIPQGTLDDMIFYHRDGIWEPNKNNGSGSTSNGLYTLGIPLWTNFKLVYGGRNLYGDRIPVYK